MNYLNSKYLISAGIILALIILGAGGYYFYAQNQKTQVANINPQAPAQEEVKKIVAEVGKLIDLPTGEDPTVATVTDITKLKDQPFFQKAKNGDKVLIYTNARKAILYDPQARKVIDVAPINIGTQSAQPVQPRMVLRNGTPTFGLTTRVETELKKSLTQLNVVDKENASKDDYTKTIVVVLNNSFKDYANNLLNFLKGAVLGDLPTGESRPKDADILVILGKDRI